MRAGARARIDKRAIVKKVARSKKFTRATENNARRKFDIELRKLLNDFDNDPVTREIKYKNGRNISGTLSGINANLFNYIGFYASDNPEEELRSLLETSIILSKRGTVKVVGRKPRIEYKVTIPTKAQVQSVTRMPWSSKSWAYGIETGIDGFNYFLNIKARASRSGKGIQSKYVMREGGFRPQSYITGMLQRFMSQFNK